MEVANKRAQKRAYKGDEKIQEDGYKENRNGTCQQIKRQNEQGK